MMSTMYDRVHEFRVTYAGLVRAVDDVVIHGPRCLGSRADGDLLLVGELEKIGTSAVRLLVWLREVVLDHIRKSVVELGVAPRGDDLEGRVAGLPGELETNLTREM